MHATVTTGEGSAAAFVDAAEPTFRRTLGFTPYHGTLNLRSPAAVERPTEFVPWEDDPHCDGIYYERCYLGGVRAAVIRPAVEDYPAEKIELVAPVSLRDVLGLADGDRVTLRDRPWQPDGLETSGHLLDRFDAVLFDFDGTLADLDVEWGSVRSALETVLDPVLDESMDGYDRAGIFRAAREAGVAADVERIVRDAELDAVETSRSLPLIDDLTRLAAPVGVCTANAGDPVRTLLERFGALDAVDVVVSRESTVEGKPDPAPLERCLDSLDVEAGDAVFVGDERTDAQAAHRAGTSFLHPNQVRSTADRAE